MTSDHRDTSARSRFAGHLRALLQERGLSQAMLARRLRQAGFQRVGEPRVSEWCNGRALPRDETVVFTIQSLTGQDDGELVALYWAARGQPPPEPAAPVPRELPVRLGVFTGRAAELRRLQRLGEEPDGDRIVAIHGLSGVGKSALAVEAAWRLLDRYPDGQLYLDLHGASAGLAPLEPADALGRLLRSLGLDGASIPVDAEEAAARYRSLLAGRRILVVLDNAASSAQARLLLPTSAGCAALVTSRNVLADLDATSHLRLDVLAPADSVLLLGRLTGPGRARGEPDAVGVIAELCAHLPLALRIAGARLAARPGWSPALLAARLRDERHRLDELQAGDLAVRASFQVGYAALAAAGAPAGQRAARTFRLLGLLAAPEVGVAMVAALTGEPQSLADAALEGLVDAQLLQTSAPGRYRMHDLLRLFARELAASEESEAAQDGALERVVRWQLATTRRAVRLAFPADQWRAAGDTAAAAPLDGRADGLAWLAAERANLLAVNEQAAAGPGSTAAVGELAAALFRYLQMGGYWHELEALNRRALRVARARGDRRGQAQALSDLATACWWLRRYQQAAACNRRSLRLRRALGDRRGESLALGNLSQDYYALGRLHDALACQQQSLAIIRELGDRPAEARALNGLGGVCEALGQFDDAVAWYESALALFVREGDPAGQGAVLANLAEASYRAGRAAAAVDHGQQAVAVCRTAGNRHGEGQALQYLGCGLAALGEAERARACWRDALAVYTALDSPAGHEVRALLGSHAAPDRPPSIVH
jgi:tetratricopeptide (TPR) repeat protein